MPTQTSANTFDPKSPAVRKRVADLNNYWKMQFYFLTKLPSAFWWGTKVKSCSPYRTEVELPFSWRTQNPFKSIYFAAQAGAAELSTGLMATIALEGRGKISMLVVKSEIEFLKKASSTITFTCEEGIKIIEAVQQAINTGEGATVTINSTGTIAGREIVSKVKITWSFKVKESPE